MKRITEKVVVEGEQAGTGGVLPGNLVEGPGGGQEFEDGQKAIPDHKLRLGPLTGGNVGVPLARVLSRIFDFELPARFTSFFEMRSFCSVLCVEEDTELRWMMAAQGGGR